MSKLRFNDGTTIETGGKYRVTQRSDGCYVIGHGTCIPVSDRAEGLELITELRTMAARAEIEERNAEESEAKTKAAAEAAFTLSNPTHDDYVRRAMRDANEAIGLAAGGCHYRANYKSENVDFDSVQRGSIRAAHRELETARKHLENAAALLSDIDLFYS